MLSFWNIIVLEGFRSPGGNDFYELRVTGYSFRTRQRIQFNPTLETNRAKKYYVLLDNFFAIRRLFNSPNFSPDFTQRYRFSDKFSITEELLYNPTINDAGYYSQYIDNGNLKDNIFYGRDLETIQNILSFKYKFNSKSGITFRARHYWSKVEPKQL